MRFLSDVVWCFNTQTHTHTHLFLCHGPSCSVWRKCCPVNSFIPNTKFRPDSIVCVPRGVTHTQFKCFGISSKCSLHIVLSCSRFQFHSVNVEKQMRKSVNTAATLNKRGKNILHKEMWLEILTVHLIQKHLFTVTRLVRWLQYWHLQNILVQRKTVNKQYHEWHWPVLVSELIFRQWKKTHPVCIFVGGRLPQSNHSLFFTAKQFTLIEAWV